MPPLCRFLNQCLNIYTWKFRYSVKDATKKEYVVDSVVAWIGIVLPETGVFLMNLGALILLWVNNIVLGTHIEIIRDR